MKKCEKKVNNNFGQKSFISIVNDNTQENAKTLNLKSELELRRQLIIVLSFDLTAAATLHQLVCSAALPFWREE